MRALFKLRCKNLKEDNKYWIEEHRKKCIFCGNGKDNLKYLISNKSHKFQKKEKRKKRTTSQKLLYKNKTG